MFTPWFDVLVEAKQVHRIVSCFDVHQAVVVCPVRCPDLVFLFQRAVVEVHAGEGASLEPLPCRSREINVFLVLGWFRPAGIHVDEPGLATGSIDGHQN